MSARISACFVFTASTGLMLGNWGVKAVADICNSPAECQLLPCTGLMPVPMSTFDPTPGTECVANTTHHVHLCVNKPRGDASTCLTRTDPHVTEICYGTKYIKEPDIQTEGLYSYYPLVPSIDCTKDYVACVGPCP